MPRPTVGVSILTNGARRQWLEKCVSAFLDNCHYRPLIINIYNNGSTDDTDEWLTNLPDAYGITWRVIHCKKDMGCAYGTNASIDMAEDCEYQIHLESDFIHMPEAQTGADKYWLHRAVEFMDTGQCDYMYLRRMENERDIFQHWWAQWMPLLEGKGEYLKCPGFWWSNNPALFRTKALLEAGTLPLDVELDGAKGEAGWSMPELKAAKPPNAYIHHWGMFAHESMEPKYTEPMGCGQHAPVGSTTCKYGFYKDGKDRFCGTCDWSKSWDDMPVHAERYKRAING